MALLVIYQEGCGKKKLSGFRAFCHVRYLQIETSLKKNHGVDKDVVS
jgi:hypothetical protein